MDILQQATAAGVTGFMHPSELEKLMELATGRDVLEVGAYRGLSAWCMSKTAKTVHSVDTFRANTAGQIQMRELTTLDAYMDAVKDCPNVSWTVAESKEAFKSITRMFDMVFLDAMHNYPDVRQDIRMWRRRLMPGGWLVLHDYGHDHFPGVKQAADEIYGPAPEGTTVVTLRWIQKGQSS